MASGWVPLSKSKPKRRERRFGRRIATLAGRLPPPAQGRTWLLDKKAHRRILREVLPPGHDVMTLRDALRSRQADAQVRSARAHQRMVRASVDLPELQLPEGQPLRLFVWTSAVCKPSDEHLPELEDSLELSEPSQLSGAIYRLWSRAFFEHVLWRAPLRASKIELAVAVTACPEADEPELGLLRNLLRPLVLADDEPWPLCSHAPPASVTTVFDQALFRKLHTFPRAQRSRLSKAPVRPLTTVMRGMVGLDPRASQDLIRGGDGPLWQAVLAELVGPGGEPASLQLGWSPRTWLSVGGKISRQLTGHVEFVERLQAREKSVTERFEWLQEMDLALLPDDGLRRSLEEMMRELELCVRLATEASINAAAMGQVYSALSGVPLTVIDAGLDVPLRAMVSDFEEALSVVRQDDRSRTALETNSQLPEGPGRRVLLDWKWQYPELCPVETPAEALPAVVLSAARDGSAGAPDVSAMAQAARVEADRVIAECESRAPRWKGASLAPLRTLARDLVLLRERARALEVRSDHLLRRIALDIDRRLGRLDLGLQPGAAFHCTPAELIDAVDLRGTSLRSRVAWRRAELDWVASGKRDPRGFSLARARRLGSALFLAHRSELFYPGRSSDSLPTLARSLGIAVVSSPAPESDPDPDSRA